MEKDIGLINNYKLLSRLYVIKNMVDINFELTEETEKMKSICENILTLFTTLYPNIDVGDLSEVYEFKVDNGVYEEIRQYNYLEYEKPNNEGYEELLCLSKLCNMYLGYSPFPTMLGDVYFNIKNQREYEVVYIEEKYGYEQIFILLNREYSDSIVVKVSEWSCGKLNGEGGMYNNKKRMLLEIVERSKKDLKRAINKLEEIE